LEVLVNTLHSRIAGYGTKQNRLQHSRRCCVRQDQNTNAWTLAYRDQGLRRHGETCAIQCATDTLKRSPSVHLSIPDNSQCGDLAPETLRGTQQSQKNRQFGDAAEILDLHTGNTCMIQERFEESLSVSTLNDELPGFNDLLGLRHQRTSMSALIAAASTS
jgi:hypothetical protein